MYFVRKDSIGLSQDYHSRLKQAVINLSAVKYLGMVPMSLKWCKIWCKTGWKWCGGRGRWTMGVIGGSSCKNTSIKCTMAWVTVDNVCVILKTEPGHSASHLTHNFLWWCGAVYWHISKLFYCSKYGQWLLTISGRIGGAKKTEIIHLLQKVSVESDAYARPVCRSNTCSNYDEAKNGMGQTS